MYSPSPKNKMETPSKQTEGRPKAPENGKQIQKNSQKDNSQKQALTQNKVMLQESCILKTSKDYQSNDASETYLFYKGKTGKFEEKCSQIKKIHQDKRKIIVDFGRKLAQSSKEEQRVLHIKFQEEQLANRCIEILQKFIIDKPVKEIKKQPQRKEVQPLKPIYEGNTILGQIMGIVDKYFRPHDLIQVAKCELAECIRRKLILGNKCQKESQNPQYDQLIAMQLSKLTDKLQDLKMQNKKTEQQLIEAQKSLALQIAQNKSLTQSQQQKKQINSTQTYRLKALERQQQEKDRQIIARQIKEIEALKKKNQAIFMEIQKQHQALKNKQQKLVQYQSALEKSRKAYSELQFKHGQLMKIYQKVENQLKKLKNQKENQLNQFQKSAGELEKLRESYRLLAFLHIFEGPVLQDRLQYKQFLKQQIESYTKTKILKTRILYKYQKKNPINFHHYIDGYPNLVLIIKTNGGMFLAGFSQSYVMTKQTANKGGLILSLTNYKSFELIKNMRSVTYDDFFIIYGNSQIRLKTQQTKVFSNFGTASGYYASQGHTVNTLLGEGSQRQTDIQNYEFHEVVFQH